MGVQGEHQEEECLVSTKHEDVLVGLRVGRLGIGDLGGRMIFRELQLQLYAQLYSR